ncbi:MAG: DUF2510 domain-containing protein [Acidimicrobiales bacterium]|nr:DUF2510 domain-containing protein [Acidimicrobiales bacterium]RZV46333.1 MAG: DUF2510 domain-containing protein [Acidimicrobiales bacterium]
MYQHVALIDWLALVFASMLLAGAIAGLFVLLLVASNERYRNTATIGRAFRGLKPASVSRSTAPNVQPAALLRPPPIPDVARQSELAQRAGRIRPRPETVSSRDIAARAARLRGRHVAARQPGFFDDPAGRFHYRYWDGGKWTEHVKDDNSRFTDPI